MASIPHNPAIGSFTAIDPPDIREKRSHRIYSVLLYLYFILKPFYLFPSGLPQIADAVMLILLAHVFLSDGGLFDRSHSNFIAAALLFGGYCTLMNWYWGVTHSSGAIFSSSLWYWFNIACSITMLIGFRRLRERYMPLIYHAVLASLLLQFVLFLITYSPSGFERETLFFNNPNQLGYYALVSLAILFMLGDRIQASFLKQAAGLGSGWILIIASLSKAALVSAIGMHLFFLLMQRRRMGSTVKYHWLLVGLLTVVATSALLYNPSVLSQHPLVANLEERLNNIGDQQDDSMASRGYDRIENHANLLLFGAGEGDYERFDSRLDAEIHSTIGNIFFSYGVIGFLLFIWLLLTSIKGKRFMDFYPLVFILLYGLTHNGIRNTLFWFVLVLLCIHPTEKEGQRP